MARRARLDAVLVVLATLGGACQETTTEPTPPLSIQCTASPATGAAPLSVGFGLDVANAIGALAVSISYGDGTQGTDPDARHLYPQAGEYVASITVTAGTQTARCSLPISVAPAPAPSPTPRPANRPPVPDFGTTPPATGSSITGQAPFRVAYNACRTVDPDGDSLYWRMDLDGDGNFEFHGASGADCRHEATYAAGTRTTTVCVTDKDCPSWPLCDDYQPLHAFQCRSYSVTATP
jgi:hypothetical protein